MSAPILAWLLRLYPRAWRRRYADEFGDLLAAERPTPRLVLDLALGALDAHLCPQVERGTRNAERGINAGVDPGAVLADDSKFRVPRSAFRVRSLVAAALLVLAILVGGLRHTDQAARIGATLAARLGPVATASGTLTIQDYSRPALRHE